MAKGSFILQTKHAKRIRELSDADAGKLLKSIFGFVEDTDEEYELSDRADVIFDYMKEEITEANAAYEKTCKARKAAIDKRWGKSSEADTDTKNTKEYNSIQKNTNDTDNDNDCDSDYEHNSLKESMCVNAHACENTEKSAVKPCGFFQNVYLSDTDKERLEAEYGAEKLKKAIMLLSARIQRDGSYANEDHAGLIVHWVMKAVEEDEVRELELKARKKKARGSPDKVDKAKAVGFDFEFEDIYESP